MATRPFREVFVFFTVFYLTVILTLRKICAHLQDPILPCDILERLRLECDLGPAEVLFFFLTSEFDFPEL